MCSIRRTKFECNFKKIHLLSNHFFVFFTQTSCKHYKLLIPQENSISLLFSFFYSLCFCRENTKGALLMNRSMPRILIIEDHKFTLDVVTDILIDEAQY